MRYVYPAIFYRAIEGGYCIEFPDVEGAITQAETLYEALEMAEDSLACHAD
ncbi:MAG: type II toxin-antitoxin system HicB family antitoxin [Selenomonadaceae bacterium]|nr:type II toxin-antitoxin system HicB family antitoxin [Selenomonadaceae bacterium]